MRISGVHQVPFGPDRVWDALLDPAVLVATIPGCERLEAIPRDSGEHAYAMTVTAGVAAIRGTYAGHCTLSDLVPHRSLVMALSGTGAPGTVDATVRVGFAEVEPGVTRIEYDADAVVGGMVGGVGQRMLTSVSKRMAAEFFDNVANALVGGGVPAGAGEPAAAATTAPTAPAAGAVFTAPPRPASSRQDFLAGIAVGAGLVLAGVIAGAAFGRRR